MFPAQLAQNYAKALVQTVRDPALLGDVSTHLTAFDDLVRSHRELAAALGNPSLPVSRRAELVKRLLERLLEPTAAPAALVGLLELVLRQGHLGGLGSIAGAVRRCWLASRGVVAAEIRAARPLAQPEIDHIASALRRAVGRELDLEVSVDPALIGGFQARAGDVVFDASLARQLGKLRSRLTGS